MYLLYKRNERKGGITMLHTICFKSLNRWYPVAKHMGNYLSYLHADMNKLFNNRLNYIV